MSNSRWNEVKSLLSSAQSYREDERADFLDRACGDDEELRDEVEKLLRSSKDDHAILEKTAVAEFDGVTVRMDTSDAGSASVGGVSAYRLAAGAIVNGRYEIIQLLGRGGMGEVYLANDNRLNRHVALKVLNSELVSNKENLDRFTREAQTVSALNHPHIVTIYEFENTGEGTQFFVAEYIDGKALNHLVGANLPTEKVLDIAMQICSALTAAHEAGVIHRDIKPENVMVRKDGYVKVLDFGLAKLTQKGAPSSDSESEEPTIAMLKTRPGAVMGTAAYMSPEQARGLHLDGRTDIWSLGAVVYEMLTGHRPFSGDTTADTIVSVLSGEPQPIHAYKPSCPPELQRVVSKALAKDAEQRYQTLEEFKTALEAVKKRIEIGSSIQDSGSHDPFGKDRSTVQFANPDTDDGIRPTIDGARRTNESLFSPPSGVEVGGQSVKSNRLRFAVVTLMVLAIASVAVYFFVTARSGRVVDSIAVLPFENQTDDPAFVYLSDGLSESLIDRLAELPQLKVISRSSSFKFRGSDLDLRAVASQLGVGVLVTGTVSRIGDDLNIRYEIVDVFTNRHLAGGQYVRKAADIMTIQNEIARSAADQLRLKLSDAQSNRLNVNSTENSEAYRYYLSGLVELNGDQDVRGTALDNFERAVSLDPNFAAAYAEIAWVYWSRANGSDDPSELMPKVRSATERALSLEPDLAKAHVMKAVLFEYDLDWSNAEKEYKRAIELSPNFDFARNNYAFFLSVMSRGEEALAELEQQRLRDPINARMALLQRGIVLTQARRFDEALEAYSQAQAMDPSREVLGFSVGYAYGGKGSYSEAEEYYKKAVDLLGGEEKYSQPLVYLAATYAKSPEKRGKAIEILSKIEKAGHYASPALLAIVYSSLDENDKAVELLEQAYAKKDLLIRFIGTGYEYDGLRKDPRFLDLVRRIGLQK